MTLIRARAIYFSQFGDVPCAVNKGGVGEALNACKDASGTCTDQDVWDDDEESTLFVSFCRYPLHWL
jgi:hypothetical protein